MAFGALLPPPNVISEDHQCRIRSRASNLFLNVYDVQPSGNPGIIIWQGTLNRGQQIPLNTAYGRFFYTYRTDLDSQTSMINGINRFCQNKEIIDIP